EPGTSPDYTETGSPVGPFTFRPFPGIPTQVIESQLRPACGKGSNRGRSSGLAIIAKGGCGTVPCFEHISPGIGPFIPIRKQFGTLGGILPFRSEEHTSEL